MSERPDDVNPLPDDNQIPDRDDDDDDDEEEEEEEGLSGNVDLPSDKEPLP